MLRKDPVHTITTQMTRLTSISTNSSSENWTQKSPAKKYQPVGARRTTGPTKWRSVVKEVCLEYLAIMRYREQIALITVYYENIVGRKHASLKF